MSTVRKKIALLYFVVALVSSLCMSLVLINVNNYLLVISTSLLPYVAFMSLFGWLFSTWYVPVNDGPGLLELFGAPFVILAMSIVLSGVVFGSSLFVYAMLDESRLFEFEPTLRKLLKYLAEGVFSGGVFLWFTGALQIPALLVGSWWFCKQAKRTANAL